MVIPTWNTSLSCCKAIRWSSSSVARSTYHRVDSPSNYPRFATNWWTFSHSTSVQKCSTIAANSLGQLCCVAFNCFSYQTWARTSKKVGKITNQRFLVKKFKEKHLHLNATKYSFGFSSILPQNIGMSTIEKEGEKKGEKREVKFIYQQIIERGVEISSSTRDMPGWPLCIYVTDLLAANAVGTPPMNNS